MVGMWFSRCDGRLIQGILTVNLAEASSKERALLRMAPVRRWWIHSNAAPLEVKKAAHRSCPFG